jgi:hypothetical protein
MLFRLVTFKIVTLLNCMFIETYSPLHLIHRHICTSPTNSENPFCFSNKNPFSGISRVDESDPFLLVFKVDEFDLENALEIPE